MVCSVNVAGLLIMFGMPLKPLVSWFYVFTLLSTFAMTQQDCAANLLSLIQSLAGVVQHFKKAQQESQEI